MLGNSLGTLGTCSEPIVNFMGTHWEQQKSNTCTPSPKEKKSPGAKITTSPHWLQDFSLLTCVLCHFWPSLMARA